MRLFHDDRKRNGGPSCEYLSDTRSPSLVGQQSLKDLVPQHHFETILIENESNVPKDIEDTIFKEPITSNKRRKIETSHQTEENGKI